MIIHQIFFQFDSKVILTPEHISLLERVKVNNPGAQHILWDLLTADCFVSKHYPELLEVFRTPTPYPIMKCDMFRYMLMHHYDDSIYLDLDFACIRSLDIIYSESGIFPKADILLSEEWYDSLETGSLHNGCLVSKRKGHPFWKQMLYECSKNIPISIEKSSVWAATGTQLLAKIFKATHDFYRGSVAVIEYKYFCSYIAKENGVLYLMDGKRTPSHERNWYPIPISMIDEIIPKAEDALCFMVDMKSMWR
jgi:mannosyltransferase OCH1-like enzyme